MAMSPLATAIALQQADKTPQEQITPANVLGAYQLSSDVAEKNYQAKLQAQMGLWGGLASLGAAGILGYPALKKALGGAANAATGAGSTAADAGITTGPAAAGVPQLSALPGPSAAATAPGASAAADTAPLAWDTSAAPTVAADYGLTGGAGAAGAGTVAADLAAGAPAAGAAADAMTPDFLASFLPFFA